MAAVRHKVQVTVYTRVTDRQEVLIVQGWQSDMRYWKDKGEHQTGDTGCTRCQSDMMY